MGVRREGREAAVQYLYQRDLNPGSTPDGADGFYSFRGVSPSARKFANVLLRGVVERGVEIDALISSHTQNYGLDRLSVVDRNVLRVALFEMCFCPDIPPAVSINEAIEIAKKYSTEESGRFVNGVLDRVRQELPGRAAKPGAVV